MNHDTVSYIAGKTTLARALSGDTKLEPEDKLFATLDTTAHRGKLPCGLGVVFIDTVGFISDLPHELIQSFSATLEDVKNAVSNPFNFYISNVCYIETNLND